MRTHLCLFLVLCMCSHVSFANEAAAAPVDHSTATVDHGTATVDHAATDTSVIVFPTDSMEPLDGYCPGGGKLLISQFLAYKKIIVR